MRRKWIAAVTAAAALLGLWGCDSTPEVKVYVENVGEITGAGSLGINDTFPGIVVSEKVTEIQRDSERTISMLHVAEGDSVKQGDVLFEYDSEALQLTLDKQNLELEQLQNASSTLQSQITALQKEQKNASSSEQLSYTVEIQAKEAEKKENDYNIKVKQREISQTKTTLANAEVLAPVAGRIVSISENGYDNYGNPQPYITIQQSGSYRVKGTINEMSMGSIMEGTAMRIFSRTDSTQSWTGTVSIIDLESATQSNPNDMYYGGMGSSEMGSSSKYPFYVELDASDGLMLGQHVYLEMVGAETATSGLWLPEYYLCYDEPKQDETQGDPYVWAANAHERLEKRYVTLGGYDEMRMAYEILDGLTAEDYIAFPSENCVVGAAVTHDPAEATPLESGGDGEGNPDGDLGPEFNNPEGEPNGEAGFDGLIQPEEGSDLNDMLNPENLPGDNGDVGIAASGSDGDLNSAEMPGTASGGNLGG